MVSLASYDVPSLERIAANSLVSLLILVTGILIYHVSRNILHRVGYTAWEKVKLFGMIPLGFFVGLHVIFVSIVFGISAVPDIIVYALVACLLPIPVYILLLFVGKKSQKHEEDGGKIDIQIREGISKTEDGSACIGSVSLGIAFTITLYFVIVNDPCMGLLLVLPFWLLGYYLVKMNYNEISKRKKTSQ